MANMLPMHWNVVAGKTDYNFTLPWDKDAFITCTFQVNLQMCQLGLRLLMEAGLI